MTDKRLLYRVILKVLTAIGIIALLFVFLNATFNSRDAVFAPPPPPETVELMLEDTLYGSIVPIGWDNQRVRVLKRDPSQQANLLKLTEQAPVLSNDNAFGNQAAVLDAHPWRSLDVSYFVYFDQGDSARCPLYYNGQGYKDTCTSNRFDQTGRSLSDGIAPILIPPHYFKAKDQLVIGRWAPK